MDDVEMDDDNDGSRKRRRSGSDTPGVGFLTRSAQSVEGASGIGYLGVALDTAQGVLGDKLFNKCCTFCGEMVGSADELNPHLTRAWAKPGYTGKVCALCQNTRNRVYPLLDNTKAKDKIRSSKDHLALSHSRCLCLCDFESGELGKVLAFPSFLDLCSSGLFARLPSLDLVKPGLLCVPAVFMPSLFPKIFLHALVR